MPNHGNNRRHDVDGNKVDGCMEDDHLSKRKVKYYLCHVLMALDSLHAAGIIHREVEPQNMPIN
jgi:serine/threonine protein kinase